MMWMVEIAVGIATGIISGFGIGGGSLLMLYLTLIADMNQRAAAGINLLYLIVCAPPALIGHIKNRLVEWKAVWPAVVAGVPASVGAAWLAQQMDIEWLKRGFGLFLLAVGTKELFCRKVDESGEKHYNTNHHR